MHRALIPVLFAGLLTACATTSGPGADFVATPADGEHLAPSEGMVLLFGFEGGAPDPACRAVGRVEAPAGEDGALPALALRRAAQSLGANGVADIERDATSRAGRTWYVGRAVLCP